MVQSAKLVKSRTKLRVIFSQGCETIALSGTYVGIREMLRTGRHIDALDYAVEVMNSDGIRGFGSHHCGTVFQVDIESRT